ncbi:MAG: hypothetical protein V3U80_02880 [Flavobacteriaceae bacterium]
MHKKLEAELISLAHQILQMKNKDDVAQLRNKARDVYEKLSLLTFVDNYFLTTPNSLENKEAILKKLENLEGLKNTIVEKPVKVEQKIVEKTPQEKTVIKEDNTKEESSKLVEKTVSAINAEATSIAKKIQDQQPLESHADRLSPRKTLEEEMKDSIPADVAANMFEKADRLEKQLENQSLKTTSIPDLPKVNIAKKIAEPSAPKSIEKTSLNDQIFKQKLQIGLNDRIAFVKHLFNFSQEDFNRVLSQINSFETEAECVNFINTSVKPEYNWNNKEDYEERFMSLIERKFS